MSKHSSDNEDYYDNREGDEAEFEQEEGYDFRDPESEEVLQEEMLNTLSQYGYQEDYDLEDPNQLEAAGEVYYQSMKVFFREGEAIGYVNSAKSRLEGGEGGLQISEEIKRVNSSLTNLGLETATKFVATDARQESDLVEKVWADYDLALQAFYSKEEVGYQEESRLLEEAPAETAMKKAGKRSQPNFSVITDINAVNYTRQAHEVFIRRLRYAYDQAGDEKIPADILAILDDKKSPAQRKKGGTILSTSQNHIIADNYLSVVLATMLEEIRILGNTPEYHKFSRDLSFQKKAAITSFLDDIFSPKEQDKKQQAIDLFKEYLEKDNHDEESLKKFCNFVASNGSNNAVEGNSSVNSGVSQRMDAPRDIQGRLLPEFERMRTSFLNLTQVFCKTFYHRVSQERQILVLEAIGPNVVDGSIRASSNPRRFPFSKSAGGNLEDQGPAENYLSGDQIVKGGKSISKKGGVKNELSPAEESHMRQGYGYYRSSTPPPSFSPSSVSTPKSSGKMGGGKGE
ncbi:MAG: hypothetical protein ACJAZX_000878 [Rickettsiales bacterium]|jgi:hypothetical protein